MNYQILLANSEQMEWIFNKHWTNPEAQQRAREKIKFILIAIDENENILGYTSVEERFIPPPLGGVSWWIGKINTYNPRRRKGIATAMLNELKKHAEQVGVQYLMGAAEPTKHSCLFWWSNNFSMQRYAGQRENESKLYEFGNFPHMVFCRVNKETRNRDKFHRIIKATKVQLEQFFNDYIKSEDPRKFEYYQANKDDFFGFVSFDEHGEVSGIIAIIEEKLAPPLDGRAWMTTCVYVRPDLRRQGIGSALVSGLLKAAKKAKIQQVLFIGMYEESTEFLHANNLDIFFWNQLSEQNKIITAGMRVI